MIRQQALTAIIPVRGGSKGIPGKNLYRLGKDTLLERSIKLANACGYIDRILVSTDHDEMYEIAKSYGVATPHLRPAELATDTAKTIDVVLHSLNDAQIAAGYVVLLQVTSPLRTLADLNHLCAQFEHSNSDAIVSLVRFDAPHPDKIQKIENGVVQSYLGKESMVARQDLPEVYALNGAFYLTDVETLREKKTFMPANTEPFIMPSERSINLDHMVDIYVLETLLAKGLLVLEEYPSV